MEEKGTCHFTQVSVKALEARTECFLCSKLFPLRSRYLSITSLSGKRPTPRNPTENQMLTQKIKCFNRNNYISPWFYISLSLGQLYVFPAADKKNITEIWWLLLHESVKINCTAVTLQNTWMKSRGEKFALSKHGQPATKMGRITGGWKQWKIFPMVCMLVKQQPNPWVWENDCQHISDIYLLSVPHK